MRFRKILTVAALSPMLMCGSAVADTAAAQKWVDQEFKDSTLSSAQQMEEMNWFMWLRRTEGEYFCLSKYLGKLGIKL